MTDLNQWQRLSPLSVIYFIARTAYKMVTQGIQGLLPLAAIFFTTGDSRWFILGLVGLVAIGLLGASGLLTFLKFSFRLKDQQMHIESGVFKRKQLHLDFDRVQNMDFQEPLYFRPFGLVVVKVESAGSSSEEVSLGGISRALAEDIRATVLESKAVMKGSATPASAEQEATVQSPKVTHERLLFLPVDELIRYGLSNNNIWVIGSIVIASTQQMKPWEWSIFQSIEAFGTESFGHLAYGFQIFIGLMALLGFFGLLVASIIGAIITQYNYTLSKGSDGRYHRTKGLFQREETSMLESKIQSVLFRQSWIAKLLNRWHIYLKQVSFGNKNAKKQARSGSSLLIPSATDAFVKSFRQVLYPGLEVGKDFTPISSRYIIKRVSYIFLPAGVALCGLLLFKDHGIKSLWALMIPLLALPVVYLRWRRYGVQLQPGFGIVRSGFLGVQYRIFPLFKVQAVEISSTFGMRRSGHSSLVIKLAGNTVTVPYLTNQQASHWRDQILYDIESTDQNFM